MLPLLVRLARTRGWAAQGGAKTAAIAAPARGRTQRAPTQCPGDGCRRSTHGGGIRQPGDRGAVDRMNWLSAQDKDNGTSTTTELFDEHDNEQDEEDEGFRGTDEMRFGVKYIGMVELPQYIREAIEAHVRPLDKKTLRHDYLRLADSIRSMNAITPRGKGGGRKAAEQREEDLAAGRNNEDEGEDGGGRSSKKEKKKEKQYKLFRPLPGEHVDMVIPGQRPAPQSLVRPSIRLKPHVLEFGRYETDAYVATIVPATYGPVFNVLLELADRLPGFAPTSVLDFGCGPAPVLWAAQEIWGPVARYLGVDVSEDMLQSAESLAASVPRHLRAQNIEFARYLAPLSPATTTPGAGSSGGGPHAGGSGRFDLVVAAFALSDLASDAMRKSTVETLWRRTSDTL
ncbi:37S ribosomal protein S22, partial [Coemansia sp. RSA 1285]